MMGADEAGTLSALKHHREIVFNPAVADHKGRVFKLIGDGTLVEFGSVVDAVNCALAIQRAVRAQSSAAASFSGSASISATSSSRATTSMATASTWRRAWSRCRARRGVCRRDRQREHRQSHRRRLPDGGEVSVKNIARPCACGSGIRTTTRPPAAGAAAAAPSANPETRAAVDCRPALRQHVRQPGAGYFTDGVTEDIITDLSKVSGLLVIARNSSFTYKGKSVDIRKVGRELGVRDVLEGSIRRAGNRIRITAQLIDAATGGHVWAERFDRDLTDIFEVQDEVTRHIVDALKVQLTPGEAEHIAETPTDNLEAFDLVQRAGRIDPFAQHQRRDLEAGDELSPGHRARSRLRPGPCAAGPRVHHGFHQRMVGLVRRSP